MEDRLAVGGAREVGMRELAEVRDYLLPISKLFPDRHSLCICLPQSHIRESDRRAISKSTQDLTLQVYVHEYGNWLLGI